MAPLLLVLSLIAMIAEVAGDEMVKLSDHRKLKFSVVDRDITEAKWDHLIFEGSGGMINETKLCMKNEQGLCRELGTVNATQALITEKLNTCQPHTKIWAEIIPKDGIECHPWCKSDFSDYDPLEEIKVTTEPTICYKNSTTGTLHFNVDDRFASCDNLEVVVFKHRGTINAEEIGRFKPSNFPEVTIKIDTPVLPGQHYIIHYRVKKTGKERRTKNKKKYFRQEPHFRREVYVNLEETCDISNLQTNTLLSSTRSSSSSTIPTLSPNILTTSPFKAALTTFPTIPNLQDTSVSLISSSSSPPVSTISPDRLTPSLVNPALTTSPPPPTSQRASVQTTSSSTNTSKLWVYIPVGIILLVFVAAVIKVSLKFCGKKEEEQVWTITL